MDFWFNRQADGKTGKAEKGACARLLSFNETKSQLCLASRAPPRAAASPPPSSQATPGIHAPSQSHLPRAPFHRVKRLQNTMPLGLVLFGAGTRIVKERR